MPVGLIHSKTGFVEAFHVNNSELLIVLINKAIFLNTKKKNMSIRTNKQT